MISYSPSNLHDIFYPRTLACLSNVNLSSFPSQPSRIAEGISTFHTNNNRHPGAAKCCCALKFPMFTAGLTYPPGSPPFQSHSVLEVNFLIQTRGVET